MRLAVLTSTPASPTEGSGTFVALHGLLRGLHALGVEAHVRPLTRRSGFHTFDRWRYNVGAALRPPDADVVLGVDLDGFLWARRHPRPPFVVSLKGVIADELRHERGWVRALLAVQARWERTNVRRADRLTAPSRYSAKAASVWYGVEVDRIRVIPEPIDLDGWRARLEAARPRPTTGPTVLAVGRMYPRKRFVDLLEAAAIVRPRVPGLRIRIVGRGPEFAHVTRRAHELGLEGTVDLLGDISAAALAVEYRSAQLFCLPTVQEAFGLVFAEAMAAGLPIVACHAGAVPEVVDEGRTAILVPPRDPEALARAIEALAGDERRRKEMGAAGMSHVEVFDVPRVARQWHEVLVG